MVSKSSPSTYRQVSLPERLFYFVFLRSFLRLLVAASLVPCSPILVTLMMEALRSSETSVLIGATQRNIREFGIHMGKAVGVVP
jgi:hypothetical protein